MKIFKAYGYTVTCGRDLKKSALNIVIEYFDQQKIKIVKDFCLKYGKSVAIVMTEHLDFHEEITIHGLFPNQYSDYLDMSTLLSVNECPYITSTIHTIFYTVRRITKAEEF